MLPRDQSSTQAACLKSASRGRRRTRTCTSFVRGTSFEKTAFVSVDVASVRLHRNSYPVVVFVHNLVDLIEPVRCIAGPQRVSGDVPVRCICAEVAVANAYPRAVQIAVGDFKVFYAVDEDSRGSAAEPGEVADLRRVRPARDAKGLLRDKRVCTQGHMEW